MYFCPLRKTQNQAIFRTNLFNFRKLGSSALGISDVEFAFVNIYTRSVQCHGVCCLVLSQGLRNVFLSAGRSLRVLLIFREMEAYLRVEGFKTLP